MEKSQGHWRINRVTAERTSTLAAWFVNHHPELLVGVVTPYRAQVRLIKHYLQQIERPDRELERIHVGTIHTFQGSQRDVLVWDLVESSNDSKGLLYRESFGNRLANVAITRAQGKLILVGDFNAFWKSPGSETIWRFRRILHDHFAERITSWEELCDCPGFSPRKLASIS